MWKHDGNKDREATIMEGHSGLLREVKDALGNTHWLTNCRKYATGTVGRIVYQAQYRGSWWVFYVPQRKEDHRVQG